MDKMFEKFVCYCQINTEKLQKSVDDLTESIPQHEASVKSKVEMKAQIEEELKGHKTDREEATSTVETATEQRDKDKKAFDAYAAEAKANIASVTKAVEALRKGLGDSFLQSNAALTLKRVLLNTNTLSSFDQEEVEAFLQGKASSSGTGEIIGILEQMGEEMAADLKEATESENASLADFNGLVAAKNKEIQAATTAIEDKTARVGQLAVDIVNAKNDLSDAQDALTEDSGFLVELKTTCAEQVKLYDVVKKMRAEEITAVGATIKILNDDDALVVAGSRAVPAPAGPGARRGPCDERRSPSRAARAEGEEGRLREDRDDDGQHGYPSGQGAEGGREAEGVLRGGVREERRRGEGARPQDQGPRDRGRGGQGGDRGPQGRHCIAPGGNRGPRQVGCGGHGYPEGRGDRVHEHEVAEQRRGAAARGGEEPAEQVLQPDELQAAACAGDDGGGADLRG